MRAIIERLKSKLTPQSISLGLDIGTSSLKVIALEKKGKEYTVKKAAYTDLSPQDDGAIALKKFVDAQGISGSQVNISVSGQSVITRYVTLPHMTLSELKSTMQFEAKQYIPFPLDEIILDCAIVKEKLENNKMLVVLAAVKKAALEERMNLIDKAGLSARIVDVDCFCLANVFTQLKLPSQGVTPAQEANACVLLNIGARYTNMIITEGPYLRFSRDIAFGGQAPALQGLTSEINSSLDYYENQSGKPIDTIYVSGGSSLNAGITDSLSRSLDVALTHFEAFSDIPVDVSLVGEELRPKAALFAVALGLALR